MKIIKNKKKNKKRSMTGQLILICVLIIVFVMLFNVLMNVFFLKTYYEKNKKKEITEIYNILNENELSESSIFEAELTRLCDNYNANYIVTDASSNTIKTSISDPRSFNMLLREVILATNENKIEVLDMEDSYMIGKIIEGGSQLEYITMFGNLDDGNFFMIRIPSQSIDENISIFNTFIFHVGVSGIVVAIIVIYFASRRFTKPVLELVDLSQKMANLDFSQKYENNYSNEIGLLGESFNQMSDTLENTICELKNANRQLQEDIANKEKIDNMRKNFIADVSHELKTPIALISGYAEGLMEGISDDEESREFYCEVIMDEAGKMNKMIKQLMQLSNLESGGDSISFVHFDLNEMIKTTINHSSIIAKDRNIDIQFSSDEEKLFIYADEYLAEEALRNIINNAFNHVDENNVIAVSTRRSDNDMVRVSVYNSGKHIPVEALENLWEKFYKVDKARTREYGGSGIGLSIVKAIMEAHNGIYGVDNVEGGVVFYLEFSSK